MDTLYPEMHLVLMQKNCLNYLTDQLVALLVHIASQLFASHYSAVYSFRPHPPLVVLVLVLTPPGQHKLKHDDTVVPRGVLCFCGSARGVYGNESGRGECGLIMEESSAGAAFILVPRESQECFPCKALSDTG